MDISCVLKAVVETARMDSVFLRVPEVLSVANAKSFYQDASFYLAFFTIVVAILAIVVPEKHRRRAEKREAANLARAFRVYFKEVVLSLEAAVTTQVSAYEEFAKATGDVDSPTVPFPVNHSLAILNVFEKEQQKLFDLFRSRGTGTVKDRLTKFQQGFESIQFIASQSTRCRQNFDMYFNDLRRHEQEFRVQMNEVFHRWDVISTESYYINVKEESESVIEVRRAIRDWRVLKNAQSYSCMDEVLLYGLEKALRIHFSQPWAVDLFGPVANARSEIINIRSTREVYKVAFDLEAKDLRRKYGELTKACETLN